MARGKKHTAEQIVNLLRQVEFGLANGKTLPQACKEAEIVEQRTTLPMPSDMTGSPATSYAVGIAVTGSDVYAVGDVSDSTDRKSVV